MLYISGWEKWQTYRKDRGTPPWIKVHRSLMTNPEWHSLSDAEKGQLISIWIVAADKSGKISSDLQLLKKICILDSEPNINKFIDLGFIEHPCHPIDNQVTTKSQPSDAPETETETETENNKLKLIITSDFILNATNQKWLLDNQIPEDLQNQIIRDFVDYWKLDGSKKTQNGWQQAFRRNPIVKRQITNFVHRGNNNGSNQYDSRSRAKKLSDKLDEIARRDIEENGFTENLG